MEDLDITKSKRFQSLSSTNQEDMFNVTLTKNKTSLKLFPCINDNKIVFKNQPESEKPVKMPNFKNNRKLS